MTDHQEEMLALHAVRALSPEEVRLIESEARYDARMRSTLEEFEDTVADIAHLVPEESPPPEVRSELLAKLKVHARGNASPFSLPFRLLRSPIVAWAAAAAIAVGAVSLWSRVVRVEQDMSALALKEADARGQVRSEQDAKEAIEKQLVEAKAKNASLTTELVRVNKELSVSSMTVALLRSSVPRFEEAKSSIVWCQEKQEGVLRIEDMPAVQPNKDYQLWVICKECKHPVSAGVIKVSANGTTTITFKPDHHIVQAQKFAISLEATGGVKEAPEGQIIFASR